MMPFFLLAKGSDSDLRLVSDSVFAVRADAIAELNRLTVDPGFAHWDAQLFVADLDSATEVLLVRPAAPVTEEVPADEPEPEALVEPEVGPEHEEEPEPETAPEVEAEDATEAAPEFEPVLATDAEPVVDAEDAALAAVLEELGGYEENATPADDAVTVDAPEGSIAAEEAGAEEKVETVVDDAWAQAVADTDQAQDAGPALKDALQRTAAKMEADGIVAPESVGPEAVAEPEAESAASPESLEVEEAPPAQAWPWDTGSDSAEPAFSLDSLEEPGTDDVSLVRAAGDDDTMAVARPVIMGAYGEERVLAEQPIVEPMGVESEVDTAIEPAAEDEQLAPQPVSELLRDLEEIAAPVPAGPSYEPSTPATDSMTCDDCIYVDTCPNKDQRAPQTCGSFQWK